MNTAARRSRSPILAAAAVLALAACRNDEGARAPFAVATPGAVASPSSAVVTGRKLALLIGNGAYGRSDGWRPLTKVESDLAAMSAGLTDLGFEVITAKNLTKREMTDAVLDLKDRAARGTPPSVVLFYYSGHGLDIGGRNYLIPIGADIDRAERAGDEATDLGEILYKHLGGEGERAIVVVLDACRTNPAVKGYGAGIKGEADAGFSSVKEKDVPRGTIIAYAARPGTASYEGTEGDGTSIFTGAFSEVMRTPGASFTEIMAKATELVNVRSGRNQTPWLEGNPLVQRIVLKPAAPAPTVDEEVRACNGLAKAGDPATFNAYLNRYPNGVCADFARVMSAPSRPTAVAEAPPPRVAPETEAGSPAAPASFASGDVGRVFRDRFIDGSGDGPELVVLPSRTFQMGSTKETDGDERYDNEGPRHEVRIGPGLAVGKNAVTVGEYGAFVKATGRKTEDGCYKWTGTAWKSDASLNWTKPGFPQTDRHPVVCVSWDDATAYAEWLSKRTGLGYRLLSESEFEYAARGGTTTRRYWDDDASHEKQCGYANGADQTSADKFNWAPVAPCRDGQIYTSPVGTFSPNDFKLYDMLGNVWQWTSDCWHESYDKPSPAPADGSAWTSACANNSRVARGGSWYIGPRGLRAAFRGRLAPDDRYDFFGFRVARTITP